LVEEVGMFSTILRTPDNIKVIIPNSTILKTNIKIYSSYDKRRIDLVARIGFDENIGTARDLLMEIMKSHPLVLPEPSPAVDVQELSESKINLAVRPWVPTEDYWRVRGDLLEQMKIRFDEIGIS
jgi:small conductance mechanosensitive channel